LKLLFAKFAEFHSARQVHIWLRDEGIELPVKAHNPEADGVVWRLPAYNTVHNILTNPIYAGAYAFGRTTSKVSIENGRNRVRRGARRPISECDVLIKDHHEGYISWEEFERNQHVIADNAMSKGSAIGKGAVRKGEVLLAGLLRCGYCGRKLHVHYSSNIGRYTCYGARANHGTRRCTSIGSVKIDAVVKGLKPFGIDAAVKAIEAQSQEKTEAQRQHELALQQARYEPCHARRHYDAVDPANRLVADELERRWNAALEAVQRIDQEMAANAAQRSPPQNAVQHLGGRPLDDLVFQGGHGQRALSAVGLWYVRSARRQCPVCSPMDPRSQISEF
jgi:Recombinase/Recombinase zinc beta ribbon domain